MATTVNRAGFWNDQVWGSFDAVVMNAAGAIRVVQKVFRIDIPLEQEHLKERMVTNSTI